MLKSHNNPFNGQLGESEGDTINDSFIIDKVNWQYSLIPCQNIGYRM